MKHRISRRVFLRGCTLLAASAAVGSLTSCGGTNAKDSGLPQLIVGSDTYPPYIYLNNDGIKSTRADRVLNTSASPPGSSR